MDVDAWLSHVRLSEISDKPIDAIIDWADSSQGDVKITGRSQNPSNDNMECQAGQEHSRRPKSDHGIQRSSSTNLSSDHSLKSNEINRSRDYSCRKCGLVGLGCLENSDFESSSTSSHSRSSVRSSQSINSWSAVKIVAFFSCESFNTGRDTKRRSNRTLRRSRRVPSSSDSFYPSESSMVSSLTSVSSLMSVSSSLRRLTSDHG